MGKVTVAFADRMELDRLDRLAKALGGTRASAEFRPCYSYLRGTEKPHSAVFVFKTQELVQAFIAQTPTS